MGVGGQRQAQAALTLLKSPGQHCRGGWVSQWGRYGWNQNVQHSPILRSSEIKVIYRVSIKSFPDYKHLLQENYVEYKHIFYYYLS